MPYHLSTTETWMDREIPTARRRLRLFYINPNLLPVAMKIDFEA